MQICSSRLGYNRDYSNALQNIISCLAIDLCTSIYICMHGYEFCFGVMQIGTRLSWSRSHVPTKLECGAGSSGALLIP